MTAVLPPENAQRQKHRKVEWTDNERNSVGHLMHLRQDARETHHPTVVKLRLCPLFQPYDRLVQLCNRTADITKISFRLRTAEVILKRPDQLILMSKNSLLQLFQLRQAEIDIQRRSGSEIGSLPLDNFMNCFFIPRHHDPPCLSSTADGKRIQIFFHHLWVFEFNQLIRILFAKLFVFFK